MFASVTRAALAAALLGAAAPAAADVVGTPDATGFTVAGEVPSSTAPAALWSLLLTPSRWWNSSHTWSGDARALSLSPVAGGCWCETLADGGSVRHGTVLAIEPGRRRLMLDADLGPIQMLAAHGKLEWTIAEVEGGSVLRWRYQVFGRGIDNAAALAPIVDRVIAEQATRLAAAGSQPAP